jgi:hypothetical protein
MAAGNGVHLHHLILEIFVRNLKDQKIDSTATILCNKANSADAKSHALHSRSVINWKSSVSKALKIRHLGDEDEFCLFVFNNRFWSQGWKTQYRSKFYAFNHDIYIQTDSPSHFVLALAQILCFDIFLFHEVNLYKCRIQD